MSEATCKSTAFACFDPDRLGPTYSPLFNYFIIRSSPCLSVYLDPAGGFNRKTQADCLVADSEWRRLTAWENVRFAPLHQIINIIYISYYNYLFRECGPPLGRWSSSGPRASSATKIRSDFPWTTLPLKRSLIDTIFLLIRSDLLFPGFPWSPSPVSCPSRPVSTQLPLRCSSLPIPPPTPPTASLPPPIPSCHDYIVSSPISI